MGTFGDPRNFQRERVNQGSPDAADQELIFEGVSPRQICPNMVGPFSDGMYYCTAREFGYCDRRSGTCFCRMGYGGVDCSECTGTHFRQPGSSLCVPRTLCKNDCSGAGSCNFYNGKCTCLPYRTGDDCSIKLCSIYSDLCEACSQEKCLRCRSGYYLTGNSSRVCGSCYDFDPRCARCTAALGCTDCADPLLTSVRRSGYRKSDPRLPIEEDTRELSLTMPFGTKSPDAFAEAEFYQVATDTSVAINVKSKVCDQGLRNDETWDCRDYPASHIVCGNAGVFRFVYPNYVVTEKQGYFRIAVMRSGGGYGNVSVSYYIRHFTTTDADMVATAMYTTSQTLIFEEGVVQRTFLVKILDDNIVEEDETFQVVLEVPEGGGSVGPQFRTNVTILDDDLFSLSPTKSTNLANSILAVSNMSFTSVTQAVYPTGINMTIGGEILFGVIENYNQQWLHPGTPSGSQRHSLRQQCPFTDLADGTGRYQAKCPGLKEQGNYQLRVYHCFKGGLMGQYYYDSYFNRLAFQRLDDKVNFTWGYGKLAPHATDFVTIRWSGVIKPTTSDTYYFYIDADESARLWVDGNLLIDHWHESFTMLDPSRAMALTGGTLYEVILEYREMRGEAFCRLMWRTSQQANLTVISDEYLYALHPIGDPVAVSIKSAPTSAAVTECTGAGLIQGVALSPSSFTVCPRDAFYNMRDDDDPTRLSLEYFAARLFYIQDYSSSSSGGLPYDGKGMGVNALSSTSGEYILAQLAYDHDSHCFQGTYTPTRAGVYSLAITYQADAISTASHVAGSPFTVKVSPTTTFGPYSKITGISSTISAIAGVCYSFSIEARDASHNRRLAGGDDLQVYLYQVDYYSAFAGTQPNSEVTQSGKTSRPTGQPTGSPTSGPTRRDNSESLDPAHQRSSPPLETNQAVVRYGAILDYGNGTYKVTVCPAIQGTHEMHILLKGKGVSNQPFRVIDRWYSFWDSQGAGEHRGEYVDKSPYVVTVQHAQASAFTSTATGKGLAEGTVNVPATCMVTVRDAWDNVVRTANYPYVLSASMNGISSADFRYWNYNNGSMTINFTPLIAGSAVLLSIYVDGAHVSGSPFAVNVLDGAASEVYSVTAFAPVADSAKTYYFQVYAYDVQNFRKTSRTDNYTFSAQKSDGSGLRQTGSLQVCPSSPDLTHPICDPYDTAAGHYYGSFLPIVSGSWSFTVYLNTKTSTGGWSRAALLEGAPFIVTILPGLPVAELADVNGPLYRNVAGVTSTFVVLLRDASRNALISGGYKMELAQIGVGLEWGTVQPWGTTPGLPNAHHYRGFYAGYESVYGQVTDNKDGSYLLSVMATVAGQYVTRFMLAEPGLNATFFNGVDLGHLHDHRYFTDEWAASYDGRPQNLGSTVSWTGDIGGPWKPAGGAGSYRGFFKSRMESTVSFDYTNRLPAATSASARALEGYPDETDSAFTNAENFRNEFWSLRYTGFITAPFVEFFEFQVECDENSAVKLWVGGVGTALNGTTPGSLILALNTTDSASPRKVGFFNFTDKHPREFVLEYVHYTGPSSLQLSWLSTSVEKQIVPASAFTRWRNVSHFNTTIVPAPLSPAHSTAYGAALTRVTAGQDASFVVYARDRFGNLMQRGGDVPSAVAFGRDGALFRGEVTDYGNSTYLINYHPTVAGEYLLFVTVGCCPPHPNVGQFAEISMSTELHISGSPFHLVVSPAGVDASRCVAAGRGVLGSTAGVSASYDVMLRDLYNNPTSLAILGGPAPVPASASASASVGGADVAQMAKEDTVPPSLTIVFVDKSTGSYFSPEELEARLGWDDGIDPSLAQAAGRGGRGGGSKGAASDANADSKLTTAPPNSNSNFTNVSYRLDRAGEYWMHVFFAPAIPKAARQPYLGDIYDHPSFAPTARPTWGPGGASPTGQPTRQPTGQPTTKPTSQPTSQPSRDPTRQPTAQPSADPTTWHSGTPAPSLQKSAAPSTFLLDSSAPTPLPLKGRWTPFNLTASSTTLIPPHSTPIVGSPFSISIFPSFPSPEFSACRGLGTRQASAFQSVRFLVELRDSFANRLITGGNKVYTRLRGAGGNRLTRVDAVPVCVDDLAGSLSCEYSALSRGPHSLIVKLLVTRGQIAAMGLEGVGEVGVGLGVGVGVGVGGARVTDGPGGAGLTARYYASHSPALDALTAPSSLPASSSSSEKDVPPSVSGGVVLSTGKPLATRLDAAIAFSWPNGRILPPRRYKGDDGDDSAGNIGDPGSGQSVRWSGFIVPPRTDTYTFRALLTHMNATVYVDDVLVFDSSSEQSGLGHESLGTGSSSSSSSAAATSSVVPIALAKETSYEIEVFAWVSPASYFLPVAIELVWETPVVVQQRVQQFFLYPGALELASSPYPVAVDGPVP